MSTDFEHEYRSVPRRRMSRLGRLSVAEALRDAEFAQTRSGEMKNGVTRWQLVAACVAVAAATHVVTRWTVERRPVEPASPAAIAPVSVSVDATVFPTRYQTRIRAWQPAMQAKENPR